jgi:hypothetical protein
MSLEILMKVIQQNGRPVDPIDVVPVFRANGIHDESDSGRFRPSEFGILQIYIVNDFPKLVESPI